MTMIILNLNGQILALWNALSEAFKTFAGGLAEKSKSRNFRKFCQLLPFLYPNVSLFSYEYSSSLNFSYQDMGAGQSKTETVYSRYEKENELLPNLKITPSVIERLNQAQNPASGPSYEAIEEEKQRLQEK